MTSEVLKTGEGERRVTVRLEPHELNEFRTRALKTISQTTEIKGFRKGRAPTELIERITPEEEINKRTMELAIEDSVPRALETHSLKLGAVPKVEVKNFDLKTGLDFVIELALAPLCTLGNWQSIEVRRRTPAPVENARVDQVIEQIRKSRAAFVAVNRPSRKGDRIEIDLKVRVSGLKPDGVTANRLPVMLGQGVLPQELEAALVDRKIDETGTTEVTWPREHPDIRLSGKKTTVDFKVRAVGQEKLPQLNDDFARRLSRFETLEALRASIRQGLDTELQLKESQRVQAEIIDQLILKSTFEIALETVEQETDDMISEFRSRVERGGLKLEEYLARLKKSVDELKKEWTNQARKRIQTRLVLDEVAARATLSPADSDVETRVHEILRTYYNIGDAAKNLDAKSLRDYTRSAIIRELAAQHLEKHASHNS